MPTQGEAEQKSEVIKLAAQYIREDIRASEQELQCYPSASEFFSSDSIKDVIPTSLIMLLEKIVLTQKRDKEASAKKITSIAHAIMSATRPNYKNCTDINCTNKVIENQFIEDLDDAEGASNCIPKDDY